MSTTDAQSRLISLLSGPIEALGLDLEAVDLSNAGKRRVLRVAVDRDGGVSMDDIAEATRAVSTVLDESAEAESALGKQAYTLEVSSPGVDRPLTLPRHWRRNRDRLVAVTFAAPEGGEAPEPVTGRITSADEDAAVLEVDGEQRTIAFAEVKKAKIQIEFKREG